MESSSTAGETTKPADYPPHPRTLGWFGATALAMGGSNQSLFLLAALFVGQGDILGQGSAAVPLLIFGLLLSWAAAPGWTELILMWPNRVGGIAATCGEAFRPYAPVLANLAGTCYWWGWVPTCGLTAILSASAIHQWYLPSIPVSAMACCLVVAFTGINLLGVKWVARFIIPVATASATLAFISALAPVWNGAVDWHQAVDFHLTLPFEGAFGTVTSVMAGLYLIGFAAPAFEAASCHVGEMVDPARTVPRAMFAAAAMAAVYFIVLPLVWLGSLGAEPLGRELALVLGPTFAPIFGAGAKAAAIWFMILNMFHGTVQPLAGASRTLAQLAEDGLLPAIFARRSATDTPWVATVLTAGMSIFFLLIGDPIWLIAAANFTYLIGITLPSVAVWLLRRDAPERERPYRAPRGTINLGLCAAGVWGLSAVLGFQQFGLPTVLFGIVFAYSGAALYSLRQLLDRRRAGLPMIKSSLHIKLTGAMLLVLVLDGAGYLVAVGSVGTHQTALISMLEDIFVAVAILTISVGLILPGMIAHSAGEVAAAADRLTRGTVRDFSRAMRALGEGSLDHAHAAVSYQPVVVHSNDELGDMAASFNLLQREISDAAIGLDDAREGLRNAREQIERTNTSLYTQIVDLDRALCEQKRAETDALVAQHAAEEASLAKSRFLANMSHEIRTPIAGILGMTDLINDTTPSDEQRRLSSLIENSGKALLDLVNDVLDFAKIEAGKFDVQSEDFDLHAMLNELHESYQLRASAKGLSMTRNVDDIPRQVCGDPLRVRQVLNNLLSNALKFTESGHIVLEVRCPTSNAHEAIAGTVPIEFHVRDSGIGIAPELLPRLFKPFSQADETSTRKYGGTGLGLAISRELVEHMGGTLQVESAARIGTHIWFNLSFESSANLPAPVADPTSLSATPTIAGHRILLAEDNLVNQEIASAIIRVLGCAVDVVDNGRLAVAATRRVAYDLVLMDCRMPEMDGYDATRMIRQDEQERGLRSQKPRLPIIGLTANALRGDRDLCLTAGMDDYLSKPYERADLCAMLERWLTRPRSEVLLPATPGSTDTTSNQSSRLELVNNATLEALRALQRAGADDIVAKAVKIFMFEAKKLVATIRQSFVDERYAELQHAAHTLKSSSAQIGACALTTHTISIEELVREGDFTRARAVFEVLESIFEPTLAALAAASLDNAPLPMALSSSAA
jgi:two-component system, sensor histidine kinase